MGKYVGGTCCKCNGKVDDKEDNNEEAMEEERNNILIRKENKDKVHSQGGYFTERHCFLGRGRKQERE
jgi:hypothetical protein